MSGNGPVYQEKKNKNKRKLGVVDMGRWGVGVENRWELMVVFPPSPLRWRLQWTPMQTPMETQPLAEKNDFLTFTMEQKDQIS